MEETIHGKLVAKKDGIYTVYVFEKHPDEFVMCTKLPGWGNYPLKIGDSGFLTYDIAEAGQKYYERSTGEEKVYQYTNIYFKDFVKDNETKDDIIL